MADVELLLDYLEKRDPEAAKNERRQLEEAGILRTVVFQGPGSVTESEPTADAMVRKRVLVLGLAQTALQRTLKDFDKARPRIESRIKTAQKLRLVSSIVTIVLSSSVVASLTTANSSRWNIILGTLATLSSIATLLAGRLEGGEAHLAKEFADVASRQVEARNLLDLVQAYLGQPDLLVDVETVTANAADLCKFIQQAVESWRLA